MAKAAVIASTLAWALVVLPPQALAGGRPPVNPAISQYVEALPTSGGNVVPGGRRDVVPGGRTRTQLPKRIAQELPRTREGALLRHVASSAAYGAPQVRLRANERVAVEARRAARNRDRAVSGAALGAAVDAVGAGTSVVLWLALALLAITGLGLGAAIVRARR